jgi:hypothetical protein
LAIDKLTRPVNGDEWTIGHEQGPPDGTRVADEFKRVWFGVLAADGPAPETIADWLREAKTIDFVCCLESGCVFRNPIGRRSDKAHAAHKFSMIVDGEGSLGYFADLIYTALNNFEHHAKNTFVEFAGRYSQSAPVRHYDDIGYKTPPGMTYTGPELTELRRRGIKVD